MHCNALLVGELIWLTARNCSCALTAGCIVAALTHMCWSLCCMLPLCSQLNSHAVLKLELVQRVAHATRALQLHVPISLHLAHQVDLDKWHWHRGL